ncbi:hypothetical protein Droror1_Dr00015174 [Drosera rotundifolia]
MDKLQPAREAKQQQKKCPVITGHFAGTAAPPASETPLTVGTPSVDVKIMSSQAAPRAVEVLPSVDPITQLQIMCTQDVPATSEIPEAIVRMGSSTWFLKPLGGTLDATICLGFSVYRSAWTKPMKQLPGIVCSSAQPSPWHEDVTARPALPRPKAQLGLVRSPACSLWISSPTQGLKSNSARPAETPLCPTKVMLSLSRGSDARPSSLKQFPGLH